MIGTDAPSRWDTVVRACSEAVAVIDHEGVIQLVSPSLERELGRDDLPGTDLADLLLPRDLADFHGTVINFVAGLSVTAWSDWRLRTADGGWWTRPREPATPTVLRRASPAASMHGPSNATAQPPGSHRPRNGAARCATP